MRFIPLLWALLLPDYGSCATELNLWHMVKEMDEDFAELAGRFSKANPDINVTVQLLPNEELKAAVIRAAEQAAAPDIILISSDNVGYGPLMRLSELPADMVDSGIGVKVKQALQFRNKNYAVPLFAGNQLFMLFNKQWVSQPAADWQQLSEQHTKYNAQGIKTLALNYHEPYWFALFADLFANQLIKNNAVNLNTPQMQQALQFYHDLAVKGITPADCTYQCVTEGFYQGEFAYAVNGSWALAEARRRLGDNLGVMAFPSWQGRSIRAHASYIVMIFPHQSLQGQKAEQIKRFVQYFRQPENVQAMATKHHLIAYFDTDAAASVAGDTFYQQVLKQHQNSQLMPASEAMVSVWNGMQKGILLHQSGTLDANQAAAFMQKVAQRDQQLLAAGL